MRGASLLLAIISFAHFAFIAIGCISRGITSFSLSEPLGAITRIVVLFAVFGAVLGVIPAIHLLRFHAAAGRFLRSKNGVDLEGTLVMQGRFWRYVGAMFAVMLTFYFIVFFAALIGGFTK